ncbi:hypothetical protein [Clostridium tyrobutyricum]|uniref:hypothetical protein n=1 Tax=Clostridium tyrobutyricum TaxID=1519 RepID=UPI001C38424B|nr:hypothetical protein [Clostridium tyrobutyricum]MBV4440926.1 hypothetical protein [Clostridium tyrobutyricum]
MKGTGKHSISFFGEFMDKTLEREFLHYDMKYYSNITGYVALIFGMIYMLFIISDYFVIRSTSSFMIVLLIRTLFLISSIIIYFAVKKINKYSNLVYLITAYEMGFFISFVMLVFQYGPNGLIPIFSILAITLAVYITPNRIINKQISSVFFNLFFFYTLY